MRPAAPPEDWYAPHDGQDNDYRGHDAFTALWSSPLDDLEKMER